MFELRGCILDATNCNRSFAVYKWETSAENRTAARDTGNYRPVEGGVIVANDSGFQNQTMEVTFNSSSKNEGEEEGFYLAIRDESTCIAITRLLVFYNVCHGRTEGDDGRLCVGML